MYPLLSPKPFADFSPAEYKAYVVSFYKEPPKAAPPAEYSVSVNAKGNPVIRVRREPKWLTSGEVSELAEEAGLTLQQMWSAVLSRKIEIKVPRREHK